MPEKNQSFYDVLTAAISEFADTGFVSAERLAYWQEALKRAAEATMGPIHDMDEMLRRSMRALYARLVEQNGILRYHPGVARWTIQKLKPQLHLELDKRILASADLIKLNRSQSIAQTLRRFSGWSTSIPAGGAAEADKAKIKAEIRKPLARLPFEERRVLTDQGHKFIAGLNDIVATDSGAIAAGWISHFRQANYDYREDHKERDSEFLKRSGKPSLYAIRDSWAIKAGLINKGAGYTDEMTQPAEECFCRCAYRYFYALRSLPDSMLTAKGRAELARTKVA